jgi:hypothetical protein
MLQVVQEYERAVIFRLGRLRKGKFPEYIKGQCHKIINLLILPLTIPPPQFPEAFSKKL